MDGAKSTEEYALFIIFPVGTLSGYLTMNGIYIICTASYQDTSNGHD